MATIRKSGKICCILITTLIVSGIIGLSAMCLAFRLPTDRIKNNVAASIGILQQETDYFSVTKWISGSKLDNYTEALYLNQALIDGKNNGVIYSALAGCLYLSDYDCLPVENLIQVIDQVDDLKPLPSPSNRFWNGYEVFVKVLLEFTDYAGIRQINYFLVFLLFIFVCYLMLKKKIEQYVFPFIIAFLFLNPIAISLCMTYSGFYYCAIIPCIIMLLSNDWLKTGNRYIVFFEIVGISTFYFNMNYFQLVSFGFPMIFYYILNGFPETAPKMLLQVLWYFMIWFIGYAGMMALKWIIYAFLFDPNMFLAMFNNILLRVSTQVDSAEITRSHAVLVNIREAIGNVYFDIIELVFVIASLYRYIKSKRAYRFSFVEAVFLTVMLFLPIGRYVIFANHVSIHRWVTYRILAIPLLAFNIFVARVGMSNEME